MDEYISAESQRLEREIREKIDVIFEQETTEQRFIREPSGGLQAGSTSPGLAEFLGELKSFCDLVAEERSTLSVLLHLLPEPDDLHDTNPEEMRRDIMELIAESRRVGRKLVPTLDRLLSLTERMLQNDRQG